MNNNASKRARRNVRRGKWWESRVAKDVRGRPSRGAGSDIIDYYGARLEAKRRKTAARWFWTAYHESLVPGFHGFCIPGFALFVLYQDGLRYMYPSGYTEEQEWPPSFEWHFPKILIPLSIVKSPPNYIATMLEQASSDSKREKPGDIPRVALHVDQRKPGSAALELWIFPWQEFMKYAKGNSDDG